MIHQQLRSLSQTLRYNYDTSHGNTNTHPCMHHSFLQEQPDELRDNVRWMLSCCYHTVIRRI